MIAIPLTNGGVTLVDDADAQRVRQFAWRRDNRGYASRKVYIRGTGGVGKKSKYRTVLLHRFVLDAPEDMQTDHRSGDGLDNQRQNLRLATNQQNCRNIHGGRGTSAYKGVSAHQMSHRWRARLTVDGRETHLGMFDTEEAAALAYDEAARRHFGEFACPNFPSIEGLR